MAVIVYSTGPHSGRPVKDAICLLSVAANVVHGRFVMRNPTGPEVVACIHFSTSPPLPVPPLNYTQKKTAPNGGSRVVYASQHKKASPRVCVKEFTHASIRRRTRRKGDEANLIGCGPEVHSASCPIARQD